MRHGGHNLDRIAPSSTIGFDFGRVRVRARSERGVASSRLPIDAPHSALEREANLVADRALAMPTMPRADSAHASRPSRASAADTGEPLSAPVRRAVEPALGADLGAVRVHRDRSAAHQAAAVRARAFTHGQHIYLGEHEDPTDVRLLAHESTHAVQQARGAFQGIQRQPAATGLPVRIEIGDATQLDKSYKWHYSAIPDALKKRMSAQLSSAFSFLPKEFPVTVEWGQFKAADLKTPGNIQVWLVPDGAPELVASAMKLYGYSEAAIKANVTDLTSDKTNPDDDSKRKAVGGTPKDTADTKKDPLTARPVVVMVPNELWTEIDPSAPGKEKHSKDIASLAIDQLGYTVEHEIGHDLGIVGHAKGNVGASSPEGGKEQSFPPDIMDRVRPFPLNEYADAANMTLTDAEVKSLGGEAALRKSPVVDKVEANPKTGEAKVWIDLKKLRYSKDEQDIILQNLKNLVLFADAARKKSK